MPPLPGYSFVFNFTFLSLLSFFLFPMKDLSDLFIMKKAVLFTFWHASNPSFMYPYSNVYCFTLLLTLGLVCSSYTMYGVTLLGYFSMYSVSPINLSLWLFLLSCKVQYAVFCFCLKQPFYIILSFFFNSLVVQNVLFNSDLFLISLVFLLLLC